MSGQGPGGVPEEVRGVGGGLVVVAAGQTDVGCRRQVNQDAFGAPAGRHAPRAADLGLLYAVADGMGGHARGEVASALAVEQLFARYYAADPAADPEEALARALVATNAAVHEAGRAAGGDPMGTTVTAALLRDGKLYVGNIGDSRTYRLRDGQFRQLSLDHSLIGEQVRAGLLTPEQARHSGGRNVITRALGYGATVEPDLFAFTLAPGDLLLLCSDGLHGLVEDAEIAQILAAQPPGAAVSSLIALARQRGGPDNITALVVRVEAVAARARDGATTEPRVVAPRHPRPPDGGDVATAPFPTLGGAPGPTPPTHDARMPPSPHAAGVARAPLAASRFAAHQPPPLLGWGARAPDLIVGLCHPLFGVRPRVWGGPAPSTSAAAPPAATATTAPAAVAAATAVARGGPEPPPVTGADLGGLSTQRPLGSPTGAGGAGAIEGTIAAPGLDLALARDWEVALLPAVDPAAPGPPAGEALAVAPIQATTGGAATYRLTAPAPGLYTIVVQRRGAPPTGPPTRLRCEPTPIALSRGETLTRDLIVVR